MFKTEAKVIKNIIGKNCIIVHHIGSTSEKGLRTKSIIDIMSVVKNITLVNAHNAVFEAFGYECKGEFGIRRRRFFMNGGHDRIHHKIYHIGMGIIFAIQYLKIVTF